MQLSLRLKPSGVSNRLLAPFFWGVFLSLLCAQPLIGQEQLGWHLQNYAGINGIALNPARTAIHPESWDLNLAGHHSFLTNNYAYLEEASFLRLLFQDPLQDANLYARPHMGEGAKLPPNSYVVDFYDLRRPGYALARSENMGPAFSFRINDRHRVGFFSRARVWAGTQNIPASLAYYRFGGTPFFQEVEVDPFSFSYMGWTELGVNYTLSLPVAEGTLSIGLSVKDLNGYEGGYVRSEESFNLVKLSNDSIAGANFTLSGAMANFNMQGGGYQLQSQGRGLGVDLGALYVLEDREGGYSWLFGFSLLDVGRIGFDGSVEAHRVVGTDYTSLGAADYNDISGPEDLPDKARLFSRQALQDPDASLVGNTFKQWLPTAVSLQVDRHFGSGWYAGAVFMQGLPLNAQAPNRGSLLAVSPRLEKKWYALSMPLSIYNWDAVRVGLAARLGPLTLGTDDLGSWLVRKNLSGGDFYLALKVPFFRLSGGERAPRPGRRRGGGMDCYAF